MILHSNNKYWASLFINTTISVFATGMDFRNDFLLLLDEFGFVALVPLNPVCPHLVYFLFVELSGDAESSDGVDVGIKITTVL
jgi:hypothetical protein